MKNLFDFNCEKIQAGFFYINTSFCYIKSQIKYDFDIIFS